MFLNNCIDNVYFTYNLMIEIIDYIAFFPCLFRENVLKSKAYDVNLQFSHFNLAKFLGGNRKWLYPDVL